MLQAGEGKDAVLKRRSGHAVGFVSLAFGSDSCPSGTGPRSAVPGLREPLPGLGGAGSSGLGWAGLSWAGLS